MRNGPQPTKNNGPQLSQEWGRSRRGSYSQYKQQKFGHSEPEVQYAWKPTTAYKSRESSIGLKERQVCYNLPSYREDSRNRQIVKEDLDLFSQPYHQKKVVSNNFTDRYAQKYDFCEVPQKRQINFEQKYQEPKKNYGERYPQNQVARFTKINYQSSQRCKNNQINQNEKTFQEYEPKYKRRQNQPNQYQQTFGPQGYNVPPSRRNNYFENQNTPKQSQRLKNYENYNYVKNQVEKSQNQYQNFRPSSYKPSENIYPTNEIPKSPRRNRPNQYDQFQFRSYNSSCLQNQTPKVNEPMGQSRRESLISKSKMLRQKLNQFSCEKKIQPEQTDFTTQNQIDRIQRIKTKDRSYTSPFKQSTTLKSRFQKQIENTQEQQMKRIQLFPQKGRNQQSHYYQPEQGVEKINALNSKINQKISSIMSAYAK